MGLICTFCHEAAETDIHIFTQCRALKVFSWSLLEVEVDRKSCGSFLGEWVVHELRRLGVKGETFLYGNMSHMVRKKQYHMEWKRIFNPSFMASWVVPLLEKYHRVQPKTTKEESIEMILSTSKET